MYYKKTRKHHQLKSKQHVSKKVWIEHFIWILSTQSNDLLLYLKMADFKEVTLAAQENLYKESATLQQ